MNDYPRVQPVGVEPLDGLAVELLRRAIVIGFAPPGTLMPRRQVAVPHNSAGTALVDVGLLEALVDLAEGLRPR